MLDSILSPEKLLLVAAVALIFLGPKRLPGVARSVGRWLGDLRKATGGMADELKTGLNEPATPATPAAPPGPAPSPGPSAPPPASAPPAPPAQAQAVETPPSPPGTPPS